jgi:predicted glycoside hydrolase/deacetylase ChbG (UPF0249 family)
MRARLILNADDFGLTRGINRAIAEFHSATLMASGAAFDDAIRVAHAHPGLGVGCHIVLTDGVPVSPPETIRTLLGPDGRSFRTSLRDFFVAALAGRISEDEIAREALAQVERIQQHGVAVTHLDTHKHTHILPRVARPLLAVAERAGIRAIRNPFEPPWSIALGRSPVLRRLQLRSLRHLQPRFLALPQIRSGSVVTTEGTLGISATGQLNATTLGAMLDAMPGGVWEMVCHPGYNDGDLDAITTRLRSTREVERSALLDAFGPTFTEQSPLPSHLPRAELINYREAAQDASSHR